MRGSTTTTMGQGAHHLGTSPAPALPNPLSRRGIGASSLPAPPLVTTRAGAGDWCRDPRRLRRQHRAAARDRRGAGARHMAHGSVHTIEHHRQSRCRGWGTRGAMPGGLAPPCKAAAATHNLPQRTFRLNLRPAKAYRLSEAGRRSAPIARQRATREERHSSRTWPTYCNKPNGRRHHQRHGAHCRPGRRSLSIGK